MSPFAVPTATYRIQLNHTFTFDDSAAVVPYLASLGISHVYASPFMTLSIIIGSIPRSTTSKHLLDSAPPSPRTGSG